MANSDQFQDSEKTIDTSQFLRIPIKRIGVVIGKAGSNRKEIEAKTQSKIIIDSDTGEVEIRPNADLIDPVKFLKAKDIVMAIGRGFSAVQSLKLAEDDYYLEVVRLKSIIGTSPKKLRRIKSRIIGTNGQTRSSIEELTKSTIVILGSTVSIIGQYDRISESKDAIMKLVKGATIESVLSILEDRKRELNKEEKKLWKSEDDEKTMAELFEDEDKEEEDEDAIFSDLDEDTE